MIKQQPKALRLADRLDLYATGDKHQKDIEQATAELHRLHRYEQAYNEWSKKTEWVQETVQPRELGMHRADVLKQRVERLHKVNAELLEALKLIASTDPIDAALDSQRAIRVARAAIAKSTGPRRCRAHGL